MRDLSPALAAHLAAGVTTLASCWKLTRRDGIVLGFTDHDRNITFGGVTYEAAAGFTSTDISSSVGLSVDNLDISAALSSDHLDDLHLAAGLYDDAGVEIWRVNWADPEQRLLERKGSIGEVRRAGAHFSAEIRGLAHYLNQPKGRLYQFTCDADLGDARCGLDLVNLTETAAIASVEDQRRLIVTGIAALEAHWFTHGTAVITSGPCAGMRSEVRRHVKSGAADLIELWQMLPILPLPGDTLTISAGCDKAFTACRTKFANSANFRGFPHMPGNSFVTAVARQGDAANDGSLLR